ncbi:MAG: DUF1552 domain-containing protein [Lentisphaerales bacterium]|nr:DUF1552 domain-containing protein [Lentisphaerales bacterium]
MSIIQTSRRSFLKSAGFCLALPLLETFSKPKHIQAPAPKFLFCSTGYGFTKESFFPETAGAWKKLPQGMRPLERHKKDFTYISNLTNAGLTHPHQGSVNLLTCANVYQTAGKSFHNSVSCDVLLGEHLGRQMRYNSLALSGADADGHGPCRSLSWSKSGKPVSGIKGPVELYNLLFGQSKETPEQRFKRLQDKQSLLDGIYLDVKGMRPGLAKNDRDKLEEYFQSIRDIENGLSREADWADQPKPKVNFKMPQIKDGFSEIKLTYELMVLALQTNQTPVISYRQPTKSLLKGLSINFDPHSISHYSVSKERIAASELRDETNTKLLSLLLDKLKLTKDAFGRSLFEQTTVAWGSNIRTAHMLKNLPMIIAGNGMENIKQGRHLELPKQDTPLANLWLTLMQKSGLSQDKFVDSTGIIKELFV